MNTYKIKVQEKISMWQDVYITVEAIDEKSALAKLKEQLTVYTIENGEPFWETQDNLDWDFDSPEVVETIEEIQE